MKSTLKKILLFLVVILITTCLFLLIQILRADNILQSYNEIIDEIKRAKFLNVGSDFFGSLFLSFITNCLYALLKATIFKKWSNTILESFIFSISPVILLFPMICIMANSNGMNIGMFKGLFFVFIIAFIVPFIYKYLMRGSYEKKQLL